MILIFEYEWGSEPCYGTTIFPVEYSSKDDLILDFQIACERAIEKEEILDFFIGEDLYAANFMNPIFKNGELVNWQYVGPTIYTLEEWVKETTLYRNKNDKNENNS